MVSMQHRYERIGRVGSASGWHSSPSDVKYISHQLEDSNILLDSGPMLQSGNPVIR